jgi:hypothetical protein
VKSKGAQTLISLFFREFGYCVKRWRQTKMNMLYHKHVRGRTYYRSALQARTKTTNIRTMHKDGRKWHIRIGPNQGRAAIPRLHLHPPLRGSGKP